MDYSSYFATTPQTLQFFGLPPANVFSEDGKLDNVDAIHESTFFSPYDIGFSHPPQVSHRNASIGSHAQTSALIPASTSAPDASPPLAPLPAAGSSASIDSGLGLDSQAAAQANEDALGRTRSSSEEKETLTPAQSRRKAQNRAAQRAFRERKERHVKDLEAKLSALESSATSLASDNERLKLALQRATTENEILRATSTSSHRLSVSSSLDGSEGGMGTMGGVANAAIRSGANTDTSAGSAVAAAQALLARTGSTNGVGPMDEGLGMDESHAIDTGAAAGPVGADGTSGSALRSDLSSNPLYAVLASSASAASPFTPHTSRATPSFLPAAATWDLIQAHPLVKRGVVDIADVCEALRGTARCDGQGPLFREEMVWQAVEGVRRGGGDELI